MARTENIRYRYTEDGLKVSEVYFVSEDKAMYGIPRWQAIIIAIAFGLVFGVLFYQAY